MMRTRRTHALVGTAFAALLTLAGCEQEGPMEEAGEQADEAAEETGEAAEEATE